jgi:hypothetical protein
LIAFDCRCFTYRKAETGKLFPSPFSKITWTGISVPAEVARIAEWLPYFSAVVKETSGNAGWGHPAYKENAGWGHPAYSYDKLLFTNNFADFGPGLRL